MDSRRIRNLRNSFDRNIVDKQFDKIFENKIFETGRQFVDGVSGARPGKRRNLDFQGITSKSVKKVGKWVSEKVDLFFDEENYDWNDENFYDDQSDIKTLRIFTMIKAILRHFPENQILMNLLQSIQKDL